MDSTEIKAIIILVALGIGILVIRYIIRAVTNKSVNAIENAIAKKKNKDNSNSANEEHKLSDTYK